MISRPDNDKNGGEDEAIRLPIEDSMERFGYTKGECPESERAAREVVNLPTGGRVSETTANRILQFCDWK